MKYTNPGILSEISEYPASHFEQYVNSSKTYIKTGYAFTQKKMTDLSVGILIRRQPPNYG